MNRILVVMVTSMGDIVHAQPIVSDLHRAFPGIKIDWAADAAFVDILRWNPLIDRVICAPLRRFKKTRDPADLKAIVSTIIWLRRVKYDAVLDLHGVYKSAIISSLARARLRYGYRTDELGEPGAAFAYNRRFAPREDISVVDRLRRTVSEALGYALNERPEFNLHIPEPAFVPLAAGQAQLALLFHATSKSEKKWPAGHWREIAQSLSVWGMTPLLPWGNESEKGEARAIAQEVEGVVILPRLSIEEVAHYIKRSAVVIGTDTGFAHLASALGVPTVMVFTATARRQFGVNVPGVSLSVGDSGQPPSIDEVLNAVQIVMRKRELL
ncbi:lipopolysaccharide heptosyltransferase I [Burkholderia sp. L27(2015)]|uniref:lipopolysaccharide heptosyltransferase I n=1 Tax=Burkholderia sp. L27(2015) TaxID=1641858 RepID=UPI00131C9C93|nr:lipopolysaccharide heptosyltransferase I [Burkholderia sp. L27(2015)]